MGLARGSHGGETAASLFLYKLRELTSTEWTPKQPAGLETAIAREREMRNMAIAFSRVPEGRRRRCRPPTGSILNDTWVSATADNGMENADGIVVAGELDENGEWLLDQAFTIFTADEELIVCHGYNCHVVAE